LHRTDTLKFGRSGSIVRFEPAVEFGLVPLVLGMWGIIALMRQWSPAAVTDWLIGLVLSLLALAVVAFGAVMLWVIVVNDVSKLTVSGTDMCLHRRLRQDHAFDLRSLDRIVTHREEPTEYVFLPKHGPPLVTLNSSDWSKKLREVPEQRQGDGQGIPARRRRARPQVAVVTALV
jgi:hypothetical protein